MNSRKPATVVIAAKAGRLGNRLFLSAYFMANARAKGYRLLNPAFGEYAPLFQGSAMDPLSRFPEEGKRANPEFTTQCREVLLGVTSGIGRVTATLGLPEIRQLDIRKSHDAKDQNYDLCSESFDEALHSSRLLIAKGWKFRDDTNLVRFHSEISRYFTPLPSVRQPAEAVLETARQSGDHIVGVHIRQGDYREWKNGVHYFETEQYAHWMRELSSLLPGKKITFLLCASDPIDRKYFQGLTALDGPGIVISDLHALSLCDVIMGPPSTFSTWASYYGRVPLCMLQHAGQQIALHDFVLHDRV
jgi:hypothetical protein